MNSIPLVQTSMQPFHGLPVQTSSTSGIAVTDQRRTSRDWDEIMRDLIRGLEQICGSNGRDPSRRTAQLDLILSPTVSTPPSPTRPTQEVQMRERDPNGSSGHSHNRRHSDQLPLRNRGERMIFVRHIETHEDLNSKLVEICRQGALTDVGRTRSSGELWGAARTAVNSALASRRCERVDEEIDGAGRVMRVSQRGVRFQVGEDEGEIGYKTGKDQRDICFNSEDDQRDSNLNAPVAQREIGHPADEVQRDTELQEEKDQRDICFTSEEDQRDINLDAPEVQRKIGLSTDEVQKEEKDQRDICFNSEKDERDMNLNATQFQREIGLSADEVQREEKGQSDARLCAVVTVLNNLAFPEEEQQRTHRVGVKEDELDQPIQVEVGSRNVEDLVVAVRDRRHLTVEAISPFGDNVLHDSLLPHDVTSGSLLCYLTGNGQLYIRHQSPSLAGEKFVGTGSTFIPIIRRNEASLELTVVLHIPEDFRFDDVIVRTVDSQLVVIGRKRSLSLSLQTLHGDCGLCSRDAVRPSFRVFVQLPREVNCRSVNASLTEDHQLIVKGEIDPLPRRNSF